MSEKTLNNIRIVNKHDTEANWLKATGFTPKQGELIVYDIDSNYSYERIKIGDGVQNVNDLPFATDVLTVTMTCDDNGVCSSDFTYDEIINAIIMNKTVQLIDTDNNIALLSWFGDDSVGFTASYGYNGAGVSGADRSYIGSYEWTIKSNGEWTRQIYEVSNVDKEDIVNIVDEQITPHNESDIAHSDIRTEIQNISALVGDASVSEQINNALDSHEVSWNNLKDKPFYEETNTSYTVVHEESFTAQSNGKYFAPSDLGMWSGTYRITLNDEVFDNVSPAGMLYFEFGNYTYKASVVDGGEYVLSGLTPNASYNIKVEEISEETTLVQIDEKFIPDSLKPKSTKITLTASGWTGSSNPWSQVVTVKGVTANSKVDLQPTAVQIVELQNNDISLMTENNDGVITAYALGNKPTVNYTMQVLITEVTPI